MKIRSKKTATAAIISIVILACCILSGYVITELAKKVVKVVTDDSIEQTEETYETTSATVAEFLKEQNISYDASCDLLSVSPSNTRAKLDT